MVTKKTRSKQTEHKAHDTDGTKSWPGGAMRSQWGGVPTVRLGSQRQGLQGISWTTASSWEGEAMACLIIETESRGVEGLVSLMLFFFSLNKKANENHLTLSSFLKKLNLPDMVKVSSWFMIVRMRWKSVNVHLAPSHQPCCTPMFWAGSWVHIVTVTPSLDDLDHFLCQIDMMGHDTEAGVAVRKITDGHEVQITWRRGVPVSSLWPHSGDAGASSKPCTPAVGPCWGQQLPAVLKSAEMLSWTTINKAHLNIKKKKKLNWKQPCGASLPCFKDERSPFWTLLCFFVNFLYTLMSWYNLFP